MATNFINNLSNTYRGSPSLQNQFATEQDYLDLFDNNQVTPQMAQAFNINDYEFEDQDQGIKSIINTAAPIINSSGDNDKGPTGRDYGYTGPGSTGSKTGFNIDDIGEGTIDDEDMPGITGKGLFDFASLVVNPGGYFARKAFSFAKQKYDNKKRRDKFAKDLEIQKEIDAFNKASAQQAALDKAYAAQSQKSINRQNQMTGGRYDGADSKSDYNAEPTAYSGSSKDGGLMGYGGKSGTPRYKRSYFKGGLVSLRGK